MGEKEEFAIRQRVLERAQAFYNGIMVGDENWKADKAVERSMETFDEDIAKLISLVEASIIIKETAKATLSRVLKPQAQGKPLDDLFAQMEASTKITVLQMAAMQEDALMEEKKKEGKI